MVRWNGDEELFELLPKQVTTCALSATGVRISSAPSRNPSLAQ